MRAPISVCIIVREEPLLTQAIASVRDHVEQICVVDTGSTPGYCRRHAASADVYDVYTGCNNPETGLIENFADARQKSFELATRRWIMWMDADDVVASPGKLVDVVRDLEADGRTFGAIFPYEYTYDGEGRCTMRLYRERLFWRNFNWQWYNWCHEVCIPTSAKPTALNMGVTDDVIWKHRRQYSGAPQEPGRNLRIMREFIRRGGGEREARNLFYFGMELVNAGLLDEAAEVTARYVDASSWDDERFAACDKMQNGYLQMTLCDPDAQKKRTYLQSALRWAFRGLEMREDWCEAYVGIAKVYYFMAQMEGTPEPSRRRYYEKCVHFTREGLRQPPTRTLLPINPMVREHEAYVYLNVALYHLGDTRGALDAVIQGLSSKADPNLEYNRKLYEAHCMQSTNN